MAEVNGKKTVSLVLYIITVLMLLIINAVAVTAAILSRPTEGKVKEMISEQFQEKSYLGQKLLNIEALIKSNKESIDQIKDNLPSK